MHPTRLVKVRVAPLTFPLIFLTLLTESESSESEEEEDEEEVPSQDDVYEEFDSIRERHGITSFAGKFVTRKYAFELPGIPPEAEYLKVVYPFDRKSNVRFPFPFAHTIFRASAPDRHQRSHLQSRVWHQYQRF